MDKKILLNGAESFQWMFAVEGVRASYLLQLALRGQFSHLSHCSDLQLVNRLIKSSH